MKLSLIWDVATGNWQTAFAAMEKPIAHGMTAAMDDVRNEVIKSGRSAIGAGGFSSKWQNALRATRYPQAGDALDPAVWIYHKIPYAAVFEDGARISGSPLLWLPLPTVPKKIGGHKMTPKNYAQMIGPLHTIHVAGKPPMLAGYMAAAGNNKRITIPKLRRGSALARLGVRTERSDVGARRGVISVPLFFGISAVNLRARFNLKPIFQQAAGKIGAYYLRHVG